MVLAHDTGTSNADKTTNNAALTVGGTETGAAITYSVDGAAFASSYDPASLADGSHTVDVKSTDKAGNTADTSLAFLIDTTAPTVNSEAITSATGIQNSTLNAGDVVSVTATFSETVTVTGTPQLQLNIGGSLVQANYASGSGSNALVFTYTVQSGQTDTNGISLNANALSLNNGTITDTAGNAATLTAASVADNASYKVDTTAPTVSSEAITSATGIQNSTLNVGDVVSVTATFSETVTVTGTPQLQLNVGGTLVQANYASGSGSNALVFTYTIQSGQTDTNGISLNANALSLNNGTITDTAGNAATLAAAAVADNASYKVDTTAPTVNGEAITSGTGIQNNTLNVGDIVSVTATFSETVTVTGTPQLQLNVGGTLAQANYASGSGSNALVFTYAIQSGQTDANGISLNANALSLNNGTITDAAGNAATLTAATVADNPSYLVDTTAPTVTQVQVSAGRTTGDRTSIVTVTFSEAVNDLTPADVTFAGSQIKLYTGPNPALSGGNFQQISSTVWEFETDQNTSGSNTQTGTLQISGYHDLAGNSGITFSQSNVTLAPAGTAGQLIDLALAGIAPPNADPVTITGIPTGWSLNNGVIGENGTWTVQASQLASTSIISPATFAGATLLHITATWSNPDGSMGSAIIKDNVEAYASGSPIFAWSGDDTLTGSGGHNTFVFSQAIGHDVVHSFEVSSDVIDLISYGWQSFGDVQAHTADDASGNAVITLATGQTITLDGVHAADLTAANFAFDATPTTENPGPMTIGDGAMLPLSGIIDNTGEIDLEGSGDDTLLQLIQTGVTLKGGGHVNLSDDDHNIIAGTAPDVTLDNIDNVISGAGQIGQGSLTLSNEGSIIATGIHALVLDTGSHVIANAGTLEATGPGGLVLESAVTNNGLIWANGGTVTALGAVTGTGTALISGAGSIEFGAGSTANTSFDASATGHLILDDAFHFTGTVSGLDGNDDIDIKGISFGAGTAVSFAENQAGTGGTLTVSDGAHTANIVLLGQYDPAGFAEKADTTNGTVITYDPHHIA
ncbi:Ig-like domain-containing protein [Bradyrhizobium sp. Ec3.3]|uniref:beta strand repeat-containing protein n=1 Tax=Bradyrhizobium sp. Ec3.3 TaxID=189753 RepID=UPI0018DBC317|nr:Ig-like domain-containing protein [Bradyrhizobium sp. Ec3.3]